MTEIRLLKQARRVGKLQEVNNHAMPIVCPEEGKAPIAEANSLTIRKAWTSLGKKAARHRAGSNQTRMISPPAGARAVAAATLPMTGTKPLKRAVKKVKTAVAEGVNPEAG
ncbi:hypothetical protein BK660_00725 [Pseudomonas brassicacearum]|uniref:Uncharacterized protein n=1 Tax=Pseudomonas brassicacearum TaxID=930166 RepID=A0A423IFN8_9PSED|nr:hypothetical protein BK660_00725 [Pseudomonas brassicacearum]